MGFYHLLEVTSPVPLRELSQVQIAELQTALSQLGYPVGDIDGLIGPKTRGAWAEFKTDVFPGNPELIGPQSIAALGNKVAPLMVNGTRDFLTREGTKDAIKEECRAQDIGLPAQIAYVLATTQWETAQTFRPVKEAFWLSEDWRKNNLRYYPYYGRGYVQLTWESNYKKYSELLGVDLVGNPDLALEPATALFVLVHGFKTGTFTGRKIADYINSDRCDFVNARRCINGLDKAHEIAAFAETFLTELS